MKFAWLTSQRHGTVTFGVPLMADLSDPSGRVGSMLTIHLFHGRTHPDEVMHDWGFDGPRLGPFEAVSFTYGALVVHTPAQERFEFAWFDDLLVYDGRFYGDAELLEDEPATGGFEPALLELREPWRETRRTRLTLASEAHTVDDLWSDAAVWLDHLRARFGDAVADAARQGLRERLPRGRRLS